MRQHVAFFTAVSGRIGRFQERLVDFRPSSLNFSSGKGHESFVRFRGTPPGQHQHDLAGLGRITSFLARAFRGV